MKNKIVSFFWKKLLTACIFNDKKASRKERLFKFIIYRSDAYFVHFVSVGILATFSKLIALFCAALSKS